MRLPAIVINFKSYKQAIGENGLTLAKICEQVAKETGTSIIIAPQLVDLALICKEVDIPVFAQHIDNVDVGSCTGHTTAEAIKGAGAEGSLINHSEHRLKIADIDKLVQKCRRIGLETIVCTNNLKTSKACALLNPNFIAVEPPELIGGDISVTTANPEIVQGTVKEIKKINPEVKVLTGAGVKNGEDVKKAIELGTSGVLLASGVVKSDDPKEALLDLISGLKK